MIPREIIDEIVRRSDIEQVIGQYVTLKRAGSNLVGLCPFHNEKSPSFTVFPGTESFYCFGCGAGGDAITFVMKTENLSYVEAVEQLAARCGVQIPQNTNGPAAEGPSRDRIRAMNVEAAKFFHSCLLNAPEAAEARAYFEKRQLSGSTVRHFYLGYAPNDFGKLHAYLHSKGYTDEEMITGFLCGKSTKTGKPYDYFRNRVMFPIVDTSKNIIAFGGRVMDDSKPKYLNTSDTPAFKKSKNLFALNYAKDHCAEEMILCEGYMDVISLHQAGFENAVATLGTSITEEHARIMAKYTKKVIISYDSDEAGVRAANRAMQILASVGVEVRILKMKDAKDPDEYIKKFGAAGFRSLLGESRTGFDFKLEALLAKYNVEIPEERIRAADEAAQIIAGYYSGVERDIYVARAAEKLKTKSASLAEDVERARRKGTYQRMEAENREAHSVARNIGDRVNPDAARNPRAAAAESTLLGLLMLYPEHRDAVASGQNALEADDFQTALGRRAFEAIMKLHGEEGGYSFSLLGGDFTPDEMGRLQKYEVDRRQMSENGTEVFSQAAAVLREERRKTEGGQSTSLADVIAEKRRKAEEERRRRENGG